MQFESWSPYAMTGLNPGHQQSTQSPAGETLPSTSHTGHDKGALPWHPDSPAFWLALVVGATVFGVFGASFNIRAGKGRAGVNVGKA